MGNVVLFKIDSCQKNLRGYRCPVPMKVDFWVKRYKRGVCSVTNALSVTLMMWYPWQTTNQLRRRCLIYVVSVKKEGGSLKNPKNLWIAIFFKHLKCISYFENKVPRVNVRLKTPFKLKFHFSLIKHLKFLKNIVTHFSHMSIQS